MYLSKISIEHLPKILITLDSPLESNEILTSYSLSEISS